MGAAITSITGLVVAVFGAVGAVWAVFRDREPLRMLERITAVIAQMPHGEARDSLIDVQRDLAAIVKWRYEVKTKHRSHFITAIVLFTLAFGVLAISVYDATSNGALSQIDSLGTNVGVVLLVLGLADYLYSLLALARARERISARR